MALSLRADSTEYVTATITADHDITGDVIEVSVPAKGQAPVTWYPADVTGVAEVATAPGTWKATYRLLVGPNGGTVALTSGNYDWLVRVTDDPEQPVRLAGDLAVS